ncbi:MAG TPA: hypothetical protein DD400_03000 [Rhodospirillaceae bacterium]|nr:hypothetical protein [Rhodospirillaceae bacterium]
MIYWVVVDSSCFNPPPPFTKWIADEDYRDVLNRKSKRVQERSLFAKGCLRALLFHVTGEEKWTLSQTQNGKPIATTSNGAACPYISLSHSKTMIACAISLRSPVGIDIEQHKLRRFPDLAAYAFGPTEQQYVANGEINAFYKIWTLREALSKISGKGIMSMINGKDLVTCPPDSDCWIDQEWSLYYKKILPDYSLSIATRKETDWSIKSLCAVDPTTIL